MNDSQTDGQAGAQTASQADPHCPTHDIQANLVRASKFADGHGRDWTLYCFFRILSQAEMDATLRRLRRFDELAHAQPVDDKLKGEAHNKLTLDFAKPSLANAAAAAAEAERPDPQRPVPSDQFRHWLSALVDGDASGLISDANELLASLSKEPPAKDPLLYEIGIRLRRLASREAWKAALTEVGPAAKAGRWALERGLAWVLGYEILRQLAGAYEGRPERAGVRSEARVLAAPKVPIAEQTYDNVPSNIVFSWRGLQALGVNEWTLASFPEPFRDGMARRAPRLRDRGASAPANWESSFGLPRMHGYFTSGFFIGEPDKEAPNVFHRRVPEALWRRLRAEIEAFNAPDAHDGWKLREIVGALFRPFGIELIHIELGQDPYEVDKDGYTVGCGPRIEHFGFRDGLSQPFADLSGGDTGLGQGTPGRNRSWSPVAPGELYLNLPDEDGQVAYLPDNEDLRCHGTYVVFRKLEQDVVGFRSFLAEQARGDKKRAARLAAEFMGRWPKGAPLVLSPDEDRTVPPGDEAALNDFLFAADDPKGEKCPLGAHIRRANPRDTGGRGEARRHRILRRGIAYGGPLLEEGSMGDGTPRGMLFVAINSRIDLQFEVVQSDWLNSGEFLGQAGLGRCPIVGGHSGGPLDSFRRAGAVAPLTGLPNFVTLRGGEYFFAPGINALSEIVKGNAFDPKEKYFEGYSLGDPRTQGLFDRERIRGYVGEILGGAQTKTVTLPGGTGGTGGTGGSSDMVFVGRYSDVVEVLSGDSTEVLPDGSSKNVFSYSVCPYHESANRITRGHDLIISTDNGGPTALTRKRLKKIRSRAWANLRKVRRGTEPEKGQVESDIDKEVAARLQAAMRRCGPAGRVDLVDDLAVSAAYGVASRIFGVRGPRYLTELAPTLPFGRQRLTDLPPDWLKAMKSTAPSDPGLISLQIWSTLVLGDTIGNLTAAQEVWPISAQAGAEMLAHIDSLLASAAQTPAKPPKPYTLVDAFVANTRIFVGKGKRYPTREAYFREAAVVLLEMTANLLAATPGAFGSIMQFILDKELPLSLMAQKPGLLTPEEAEAVIYECDRLNPVLPLLQRHCVAKATLRSGATVDAGNRITAIVTAANLDPKDPDGFGPDAHQFKPGKRLLGKYLMFGSPSGNRTCWGRDYAMAILIPCLQTAASLRDLRRVAGEAGEPRKILDALTIGLPGRFTPVRPGP